jgi:hypothetical protein
MTFRAPGDQRPGLRWGRCTGSERRRTLRVLHVLAVRAYGSFREDLLMNQELQLLGDEQGCFGLQNQPSVCKFADTFPEILPMESCLQICRYCRQCIWARNDRLKQLCFGCFYSRQKGRKQIPGQKESPTRTLVKTTTSQLVSLGPRPHCSMFLEPPRKTTQVSSGIRIATAAVDGSSHQKQRRFVSKWKDDLALFQGLQKPTNGISTCAFCIYSGGRPGCQSLDCRTSEAETDNKAARFYGPLPFAHR